MMASYHGLVLPAKNLLISCVAASMLAAQGQPGPAKQIAAQLRANDLKADVSFLASDALQGRATPSPGLDIAAEYIAAQFRRAGLEPVGDDGYFQNANYQSVRPNVERLMFTLENAKAAEGTESIQEPVAPDLNNPPAFKEILSDTATLDALAPAPSHRITLLVELP